MTISGWGEVIITSGITPSSYSSQSIFSDGSSKLTINNITFANIKATGTSYAYYNTVIYGEGSSYGYPYMTFNNCTFVNNTAGNAIIGTTNSNGYANV